MMSSSIMPERARGGQRNPPMNLDDIELVPVGGQPLQNPAAGVNNAEEQNLAAEANNAEPHQQQPALNLPQIVNNDGALHGPRERGRLQMVWHALLFSDKSVEAMTILYTYGYFVSIWMTLLGSFEYMEFGRSSTVIAKSAIQSIGLVVSGMGVYGCYKKEIRILSLFFVYQLIHMIFILSGLYYLFRTSREEVYEDYVTEPFYNVKLVDYPFATDNRVVDMSAEPAYELSLLYFRAFYMMIVTTGFNLFTLYHVSRRLWKQPPRSPAPDPHFDVAGGNVQLGERNPNATPAEPKFYEKVFQLLGK